MSGGGWPGRLPRAVRAALHAAIAVGLLGAGAAPAGAGPVACTTEPTEGCCANVALDCGATSHQVDQRNILLIVSDDQGYCSYRFLREAATGVEGEPDPGAEIPDAADLTCRYRDSGLGRREKESFQFDRGAYDPLVTGSGGTTQFVGIRTPTIDRLAAQGAVFPRVHLAANVCDPSLSSLFTGKHLKDADVGYLRRTARDFRTCECRLTNQPCGRKPVEGGGFADHPLQPQCANNGSVNNDPECDYYDRGGACVSGTCQWGAPVPASWNGRFPCTEATAAVDCVNTCGPTRTVTKLLHEAPVRGASGYRTQVGPKAYQTLGLVGDPDAERLDFRVLRGKNAGRFSCPDETVDGENCYAKLTTQQQPPACTDPPCVPLKVRKNLAPVTDFIDKLPLYGQVQSPTTTDGYLWQPFFLVYSPNLPHWGLLNLKYFREHFCDEPEKCDPPKAGRASLAARYLANVEILDYGLRALVKHLQRSCVCADGEKKSLYDTTVIAFLSDNGWMLPKGKGARNTKDLGGENGFRTPLIVSLPEHRAGTLAPQVFPDQLVHATDVTRTLLAYANNDDPAAPIRIPWDLKGTDLRPVIAQTQTTPIRDVLVGQWADGQKVQAFADRWFLVTRPGLVGVCTDAGGATGAPLTFCLEAGDCAAPYDAQCRRQDLGAAKSRICMNRPTLACDSDDECAAGLCFPSTCLAPNKAAAQEEETPSGEPAIYGFADFKTKPCLADAACHPPGICQAPVLRYAVRGTPPTDTEPTIAPTLERVYLLTADPDEKRDLLSTPGDDLDVRPSMRTKLRECMAGWDLWKPGESATTCGSPLSLKYGG